MNELDTGVPVRGGRMQIPRSRGATSGFLLILLGAWGALIPFIGAYFNFAYTPDQEWTWTAARGWLEVLPGAATALGGLLLLISGNRATAMLGGWLAVLAGAWFVVGRAFAGLLSIGDPGTPVASTDTVRVWMEVAYFSGLGALIVFLGALALGRVSVRSLRDIQHAHRPETGPAPVDMPEATKAPATLPITGPRHAGPETEPVAEADATTTGEPHRRGLFRRHRETTPAGG
jgi:hypothetical protein